MALTHLLRAIEPSCGGIVTCGNILTGKKCWFLTPKWVHVANPRWYPQPLLMIIFPLLFFLTMKNSWSLSLPILTGPSCTTKAILTHIMLNYEALNPHGKGKQKVQHQVPISRPLLPTKWHGCQHAATRKKSLPTLGFHVMRSSVHTHGLRFSWVSSCSFPLVLNLLGKQLNWLPLVFIIHPPALASSFMVTFCHAK